MKRNCNFNRNPAFFIGITLLWISVFIRNMLELNGPAATAAHFLSGASCALVLIGLLYGSPKTRPLFDRFHTFKLRLLGRAQ
ncbi:MAG: hypothetical protein K2K53_05420 [Oscillospiraceae bacterium]|nr:hypothetical protein [Oscillospiraceae bacterium]